MDHFGGVAGLAKLIEIKHFWDRGLPDGRRRDAATSPTDRRPDDPLGVAYRQASKGKRTALKAGDPLPFRGGLDRRRPQLGGQGAPGAHVGGPESRCARSRPRTCRSIPRTTRGACRSGSGSASSTSSIAAT